jgi:hypothetical protein
MGLLPGRLIAVADELITFIAAEPGMADRLIRVHVPDERGRCRACSIGAQAGNHQWPCKLRSAADAAKRAGR